MNSPEFKGGDVEGHALPLNPPADAGVAETDETIPADADVVADDSDEYTIVRLPNGQYKAFRKADIEEASEEPATSKQNLSARPEATRPEDQFYVHLADGSVERVKESDLPTGTATNAVNGHWERDGKVYLVIGVYPVEDKTEGSK